MHEARRVISMSTDQSNEGVSSAGDPAHDFLEFWKNYFEQTAIQTRILLDSTGAGKALDQLQIQGLESLSQSVDSFMRTPAFLEVLKQSLKRMIDLKLMQDQAARTVSQQTGVPMTADVRDVIERVHGAEQSILKQLANLDDRLQTIEQILSQGPVRIEREGN
jgi:hypothetical protein